MSSITGVYLQSTCIFVRCVVPFAFTASNPAAITCQIFPPPQSFDRSS